MGTPKQTAQKTAGKSSKGRSGTSTPLSDHTSTPLSDASTPLSNHRTSTPLSTSAPLSDQLVEEYFERIRKTSAALPVAGAALIPVERQEIAQQSMSAMGDVYFKKDKIRMAEMARELSVERIISGGSASIGLCRRVDSRYLEKLLMMMLLQFADSFSISNNLNEGQITDIVAELMVNYSHLKLEDITLFLGRIKRGEYGTIYSLDVNKLLTWLREYDVKRTELIVAEQQANHAEHSREFSERVSAQVKAGWEAHQKRKVFEEEIKKGKKK